MCCKASHSSLWPQQPVCRTANALIIFKNVDHTIPIQRVVNHCQSVRVGR
jgi:hypothetical protein